MTLNVRDITEDRLLFFSFLLFFSSLNLTSADEKIEGKNPRRSTGTRSFPFEGPGGFETADLASDDLVLVCFVFFSIVSIAARATSSSSARTRVSFNANTRDSFLYPSEWEKKVSRWQRSADAILPPKGMKKERRNDNNHGVESLGSTSLMRRRGR